jgi:hypothetical protein
MRKREERLEKKIGGFSHYATWVDYQFRGINPASHHVIRREIIISIFAVQGIQ